MQLAQLCSPASCPTKPHSTFTFLRQHYFEKRQTRVAENFPAFRRDGISFHHLLCCPSTNETDTSSQKFLRGMEKDVNGTSLANLFAN